MSSAMQHHFLRVPYLAKLDNQIQPGQSLIVRGVPTGKKFDINLALGPNLEGGNLDHIAFHASWRKDEGKIVLNTLENGEWRKEERHSGSDIKEGQPFDIRIRAHDSHFEIFVQHKKLADFQYRLPINAITHIYVSGAVQLQGLAWEGNYYPVPYKVGFPGHFTPDRRLFITGVPDKSSKGFQINLYAGPDIAFHYNPRFTESKVVRNSKRGGSWEQEEKDGKFPFNKQKQFDIIIVSEGHSLQVYVDGEHNCSFANRFQPNQIDGVGIEGDVELQSVAFD